MEFASNNYLVFASARKITDLEDLKQKGIKTISLDITDKESINLCIKEIINDVGKIDILINNAGYGLIGPLAEIKIEDLRYQMETNVIGQMMLTQKQFHL